MISKSVIAERIRNRRTTLGLTQKDVATKLNVSFQTVSKYEIGKISPDIDILNKLSEILDCSIDYLLGMVSYPYNIKHEGNNAILETSSQYPRKLTPIEVDTVLKYLEDTNYDVDKLIKKIKNGEIKY